MRGIRALRSKLRQSRGIEHGLRVRGGRRGRECCQRERGAARDSSRQSTRRTREFGYGKAYWKRWHLWVLGPGRRAPRDRPSDCEGGGGAAGGAGGWGPAEQG